MFKSKMVSFGFKNEGSCVFRPGRGPANLEVEIPGNLETFLISSFHRKWDGRDFTLGNLDEDSPRLTDIHGNRLPNGEHPTIHWNR